MRRQFIIITSMLCLLVTTIVAQDGGNTQRIEFPSGKKTMRLKGAVELMNPDTYILRLRAGQRLAVKLRGEGVAVRLVSPTDQFHVDGSQRFDETALETGDYRIVVHRYALKSLHYQLDIRLR